MVNEWEIMFVHLQKLHVARAWRFVMTLITSEISRKTVRMQVHTVDTKIHRTMIIPLLLNMIQEFRVCRLLDSKH